ncbi:MAG: DUF4465 domain-containing protein [Bacteroidota bacterium]
MKKIYIFFLFLGSINLASAQSTADFENFDLPLDTFLNNTGEVGSYTSGDATFPNSYSPDFGGFWASGWAISTLRNDSTFEFSNLGSAIMASGFNSPTYAIGQQKAIISIGGESKGKVVNGAYFTNTTYAFGSMSNGDQFAKKFGGDEGTDPDFFKLEVRKFADGQLDSTKVVEFYLADFRFEADSLDYIVNDWQWVDLSQLGNIDSLEFTLVSSDVGDFGINTPLFFAMDNLEMTNFQINVPTDPNISTFEEAGLANNTFLNGSDGASAYESGAAVYPTRFNPDFGGFWESGWAISTVRDSATSGFGNLYAAKTGAGFTSFGYAIGQQNAVVRLKEGAARQIVNGLYLTNTTYAHNSMRDGDQFAKKFGGESGDDPDFFQLDIKKYSNGQLGEETVTFYLADYRFDNSEEDYIVNDWQWVDLTSLGNVDSLLFTLSSSDVGDFGINTPLFFAIDNLEVSEEISTSTFETSISPIEVTIFPNPTTDFIFVELDNEQAVYPTQIFDLMGRQVLETRMWQNENRIDVSSLKTGTYLLQVETEKGLVWRLFVKQ